VGLPVLIYNEKDPEQILNKLKEEYRVEKQEYPSIELINSWRGSLNIILKAANGYPIFAEFPIFNERCDFLIVGKDKILVIEAKAWKEANLIDALWVSSEGKEFLHPCYQLMNYVNKLRYFYSLNKEYEIHGLVLAYNDKISDGCKIIRNEKELRAEIEKLGEPASLEEIKAIVNGRFMISKDLIALIKERKEELIKSAIKTLLQNGYGLTHDQMNIVKKVMDSLERNENKVYLVHGEVGSGKTLVAITLFLEALSKGYRTILAYRNNRLLNTLRFTLKESLPIMFYSTGPPAYNGVGEKNFPIKDDIDLLICDEAQRMREEVIMNATKRARICVYFYDTNQILIGDEEGTRENFLKYASNYEEAKLEGRYRIPVEYVEFVKALLDLRPAKLSKYDFRIFDNIIEMLMELESTWKRNHKIALICAFTESEGVKFDAAKSEEEWKLKNRRVGYPLQSGFDLYKGLNVDIYWLMDEKKEYPKYWAGEMNPLKRCASVYGSQGFEADYVGLIWGRDLVLNNDLRWEIRPEVITDNVGNRNSLKSLAKKDRKKALRLLLNRYYIMLTRGIRGTFVFFEDIGTRKNIDRLLISA